MMVNESDLNPLSKMIDIEMYLSTNDSLNIADFYSCLMDVNDPKTLIAADLKERLFKLKRYYQQLPTNALPVDELVQHIASFCEGNQIGDWEMMFLICYHQKNHVVESVIEGCASLLRRGEYEKVSMILSKSWLRSLAPLLVVLTWQECSCFSDAVLLLENLLTMGKEVNILTPACMKLENHKKHVGWCINKVGEFLGPLQEDSESILNALFKGLRSTSLLTALNDTKLITSLKYSEAVYLLENQPDLDDSAFYGDKILFERDIYCCYYILQHLIDLIVCSACGTLIEYNGEKVHVTEELVSDYISDMRFVMENISSHTLKVELLENLFSLLFLRRSDFKHQPSEDIDSDNVSMDSNLSRAMSRSLDSLLDDHVDNIEHSITKSDFYNSVQFLGGQSIPESLLLNEISESSCGTVKSAGNQPSFPSSSDMSPGFVTSTCILKKVLSLISDDLILMSSRRKKHIQRDLDITEIYSQELEHRMSLMTNYSSEALWRLELVSGCHSSFFSRFSNMFNTFENNALALMLSSSESLVYLTMRKQNLVQAKQVVKMYSLNGQSCCEEVDFMEELSSSLEKLKTISLSSKSMESQHSESPLDMIRSNVSAGKISSEATEIAQSLLQHPVAVKGIHDFPMIDTCICIDLLFSVSLSFPICKSLLDLASLKTEICEGDDFVQDFLSTKLKLIKMFLQFMNNKKHSKIIELHGYLIPRDFLTFYITLPNKVYPEMGGFTNKMFQDGKDAFDELQEWIKSLYENYKDLIEDKTYTDENDLLISKASCLFSVFTTDVISKMNNISSVYDYFKSLIKYVNKFSRWQLNHKSSNEHDEENEFTQAPKTLNAANPFLVFNEDISNTFGRLLFDWGVPPKKLESFAIHTNIKLVKIIAERCGVFVASSKKQQHRSEWFMLFQERLILNKLRESRDIVEIGRSPQVTVEMLLGNVIDIRNKASQLHDAASEICEFLNLSVVELRKVDMHDLTLSSQKLSFLVNLFNLLFLHSLMLISVGKYGTDVKADELIHLLNRPFGRLIFHNYVAYKVGNLGVITALDLYRSIVKCESASSYFGIHSEAYSSKIPPLHNHVIENCDKNLCITIFHELLDSSTIPIFYPDTMKITLENMPSKYLEENIKIIDSKVEVSISKFILLHKKCFNDYLVELMNRKDINNDKQCDHDDGYDSNDLVTNGVLLSVDKDISANDVVNDEVESDDSCVSEYSGYDNDVHSLLTHLSDMASPDFSKILKHSLSKCYSVKVEKENWFLSNINRQDSNFIRHPVVQRAQTFSPMSDDVSCYLEEACQLAGTLIELCLVKNQLLKQLTTIFSNNVLYNSVNEKDKMLSVYTSLQDGLTKFKKFNKYNSIKNIVAESSILFENFMKNTEYFEFFLPSSLMNRYYSSIQNLFCHTFIHSLSPDQWSEIVPILLECSFHSQDFWKVVLSNLELFTPMCKDLFEIVLCHCISQIKDFGKQDVSAFDLKHTLKRQIILLNDPGNIYNSVLQCENLLSIDDVMDLIKICLEDKTCNTSQREQLCSHLEKCKWYKQLLDLNLCYNGCEYPNWQFLQSFVEQEPEKCLELLISSGSFYLIETWCQYFDLPENVFEQCLQWRMKHILNNDDVDYLTLQLNLDKIKCDAMCLRVCNYLLSENDGYNCKNLFIIQYMTNVLSELLDPMERDKLILNKIGILLVEMIPVEIQDSYQCLQNNPLLIVEQLLMNMKVKLAEKALKCIHLETLGEGSKDVSNIASECDELVARYAQLALDLSGLEQNRSMDGLNDLPDSENDAGSERRWSTISQTIIKEKENYSPQQPVDRKKWVKDNDVVACMLCRDLFNMFNRRHHCRHCGKVTCKDCSPYYCYMVRYKRKVRTCVRCYDSNYQKAKVAENIIDDQEVAFDIPSDLYVFDAPTPYTLTCDKKNNEETKTAFTYEKAPSASLCLSIVDLCANHCAAAGLLIKFSKAVSEYLHENHEGIDLTVVAKMIELILYHAKLKFLKAGDFDGIELTETYCSQIETVKILVESNWPDIPTMLELTQNESLRRLRDQLLEKEQFNLAMEVTKKSALDSTINFLMGLSRLKYGDLEKARVYFARCLTSTKGESLNAFGPNHHYLRRIVEEIENSLFISINHVMKVEDALFPISVIKNLSSDSIIDSKRYEEILFYLKSYGSCSHLLNFFFQNRLFKKADSFIRKEKCTPELFVAHLLIPAFQEGCFELLCSEMNIDTNFRFWAPFIHHACKYLSKQGMFHCLYELQLVIKDLFRAALTCVRFYLGSTGDPPKTYGQLNRRKRYLQLASYHLENLLKERSRPTFVSHVGYSLLGEDIGCMNQEVPTADVKQHLSTINLQIEVTDFINSATSQFELSKLFTLFGKGKERAELVIQILMFNCEGSISLAFKIIKEFKLPSLPIISRAVKRIVHHGKGDVVTSMIQQIEQSGLISSKDSDEILLQAVKVMVEASQNKSATQFIKLMKSDVYKVNALISCGHLREAYLEAVKNERYGHIENILDEARKSGQRTMIDICEKWLRNYNESHRRGAIN